jgi:mannosyl-3-phosphoglycerate phosphatase
MPLMMTTPKLVIFTDLDGTLLDRNTYSFEPALPALHLIRQKDIPLILTSSKTRAEIEFCQAQLQINIFHFRKWRSCVYPEGLFFISFPLQQRVRGIFDPGVWHVLFEDSGGVKFN